MLQIQKQPARLVLGAEQCHAAQRPLLRRVLGAQVHGEDEVEPAPRLVLVCGRRVRVAVGLLVRRKHACNEEHGQRREEHLGDRVGELVARLVPTAAVEEEAVNVHALVGPLAHLVLLHVDDLGHVDNVVERPALLGVLAAHLLTVGGQEALRVEEAGEPEDVGPPALEPAGELLGAVDDGAEPGSQRGQIEL